MAYCTTAKAYHLWCLNKHKIIITRDVIFDEETPTPQQWVPNPAPVPSAYSSLYPLNNSVSTDVSSSMNTEIPTSSHTLPITSASGVSLPGLQEAVGASHSDLHEAVGDNHSNLSTPSTGSPDPMLTMGLSTPRSESFCRTCYPFPHQVLLIHLLYLILSILQKFPPQILNKAVVPKVPALSPLLSHLIIFTPC